MFFNMKDISCDFSKEMEREEWVCDFVFAVAIMQKLNELHTKLQGKSVFAHELYLEVKAFQSKLKLFAKQLNENFVNSSVENTSCYTSIISQVQFPVDGFNHLQTDDEILVKNLFPPCRMMKSSSRYLFLP